MAVHFALQAWSFSPPSVTIFTDGPTASFDAKTADALTMARARGCIVDERKVLKLERLPHEGVRVELDSGPAVDVAFLANKPLTEPASKALVAQLGLETRTMPGFGEDILRNEPFGETSLRGCFVAGDAGTPMKQVTNAMNSGGGAGAGIHNQLCTEEGERALLQWKARPQIPQAS